MVKDIEDNELKVGDWVYYAKHSESSSRLISGIITRVDQVKGHVGIGRYNSHHPALQIIKLK